MIHVYKGKEFQINVNESGDKQGWFRADGDNSDIFCISSQSSFEDMKLEIRKKVNAYYENVPSTEEGWIEKFECCVVRDGYEDWHINNECVMELLKLYKEKA